MLVANHNIALAAFPILGHSRSGYSSNPAWGTGVDKKDIDISVGEDSVTIKGETRKEEKEEKGDYYRCEISSGSFSRTVALPAAVDGAKATATFKDGVLELTLPKLKATKRHKISVK